jgi:hypothetical protein
MERSCGREAEGGGLLNRYTVKSRIEGSNPSGSASPIIANFLRARYGLRKRELLRHSSADLYLLIVALGSVFVL